MIRACDFSDPLALARKLLPEVSNNLRVYQVFCCIDFVLLTCVCMLIDLAICTAMESSENIYF